MTELTPVFDEKTPLYDQLYRHIVSLIRSGELRERETLPSKRRLAEHLGVSLTTVEKAYGLLAAEGYLEALPRKGFIVSHSLTATEEALAREAMLARDPELAELTRAAAWEPEPEPELDECFSTSAVDTSVFPFATWAKLSREAVYENPDLLQRGDGQGDWGLRAALSDFLHQYRGVRCAPEQVVVTAGMEGAMWIVYQLLSQYSFGLEDPGYTPLRRLLGNLERPWTPIDMDDKGVRIGELWRTDTQVAYVTPSHQFPLGVTTPMSRRGELLNWAYQKSWRYIIEDDYDSEFRYDSRPIPAMQGMDTEGRVIYVGTFSRTIAPSIRIAYLILPPGLVAAYRRHFGHASATVSRFEQETLRRFLVSGAYGRHLRRAGHLYRRRRDALAAALEGWGEVRGADAGLHLLFTLPGREEEDLVDRAAQAGYRVRALEEFCRTSDPLPGTLVLGFAGLPKERAEKAVEDLKRAFLE